MKKLFLFFILLLAGKTLFAQDYAPLPDTGIRRYFTNNAGYLRGIRVDSVVQEAGYKRYVTFRTARGWKNNSYSELADSNGACWIGKNIRSYPNGDWHFPNVAGDTLLLKTRANVGDTWAFYTDTSTIWTEAKVLSVDTQMVFGVLDSVKRIGLTVKNGTVALTSNAISSFQVILSKTMGFVQVPDLYSFPYKDLNLPYPVQDYWYRKLKFAGSSTVDTATLLFTHVSNWNLPEREMYDLGVGDVTYSGHYWNMNTINDYFIDTVIARQDFPSYTEYTYKSSSWRETFTQNGPVVSVNYGTHTTKKTNKLLFDTLHMPEEYYGGCYTTLYCNFKDTSFCSLGLLVERIVGDGCGLYVGGLIYPAAFKFKKSLGSVYYRYGDGDGQQIQDDLYSYRKNGVSCGGIPAVPSGIAHSFNQPASFRLYPQPAGSTVFLEASQLRYPATIRIQNLQGQLLSIQELPAAGKAISTANLPAGLCLLTLTDAGGKSAVQKLLIGH